MAIFTDPVAQVIVKNAAGDEWNWTSVETPYLTGVSITYERGRVSAFTFSVDIPYDKGIEFMADPSPFTAQNAVKVRVGYAASGGLGWTNWAGGIMSNGGSGISVDPNGVSGDIQVNPIGQSAWYDIDKEALKGAGWDYEKILGVCAEGMGVTLVLSPNATEDVVDYLTIGDGLTKATSGPGSFPSHLLNMSYYEIVKKVCNDMNWYFMFAPSDGDTYGRSLHVGQKGEFYAGKMNPAPALKTYMIRGVIDEETMTYPCLSWSPEGSNVAQWLASTPDPAAHGVVATTLDEETGEIVQQVVNSEDQPTPTSGNVADTAPTDTEVDGMKDDETRDEKSPAAHTSYPVQKGGEKKALKAAESRQEQGSAAQVGVITTLGLPDELPGNLCKLKGAGQIYDGLYVIEKLTHSYAGGSWEMSLTVRRHGRVLKQGEQKETPEGQLKE